MMISRFIHPFFLFLFIGISACAQTTSSFYVKLPHPEDIEQAIHFLQKKFTNAEITRPFAQNRFENLHHVIRMDGHIYMEEIKDNFPFPIDYIEKVPIGQLAFTPDDLGIEFGSPNQWSLYKVKATGAWDYSHGAPNVMIAVVDNAFLIDHPDLANKVRINNNEIPNDGLDNDNNGFIDDYAGWNARNNSGDIFNVSTNSNHGTHIAGIAAAETNNQIGIASLSFDTQLLPIKAGDANDNITHGYEGINFAVARGAKIINCSWGSFDSSATAKSVINFALSQNCFVVASCGNFATEQAVYPATYQGVISVASTTQSDVKLNTSSFNQRVNICAPGAGIWSTISSATAAPDYGFMSGTSMAASLTSALLGLMSGYAPPGNDSVILHCMYFTAVDIYGIPANNAYDNLLGAGRIDAENAMRCLNNTLHLGVHETSDKLWVSVFPNPTTDYFQIISLSQYSDITWTLKNINGQEILRGNTSFGNISQLSAGIYVLDIFEHSTGKTSISKIIKQ